MSRLASPSKPFLAAICTGLLLAQASFAAEDEKVSGTITSYECGDNCYLTVTSDSGVEHVGLCAAPECAPWNEVAQMPQDMLGRGIVATVAVGTQFDADGNDMGEMMAFERIEFID